MISRCLFSILNTLILCPNALASRHSVKENQNSILGLVTRKGESRYSPLSLGDWLTMSLLKAMRAIALVFQRKPYRLHPVGLSLSSISQLSTKDILLIGIACVKRNYAIPSNSFLLYPLRSDTLDGILPRMGQKKVTVTMYICERCDHEWIPRDVENEPRVCPHCKSPYWNKPRRQSSAVKKGAAEKPARLGKT